MKIKYLKVSDKEDWCIFAITNTSVSVFHNHSATLPPISALENWYVKIDNHFTSSVPISYLIQYGFNLTKFNGFLKLYKQEKRIKTKYLTEEQANKEAFLAAL